MGGTRFRYQFLQFLLHFAMAVASSSFFMTVFRADDFFKLLIVVSKLKTDDRIFLLLQDDFSRCFVFEIEDLVAIFCNEKRCSVEVRISCGMNGK